MSTPSAAIWGGLLGMSLMVLILLVLSKTISDQGLQACAKIHNVYSCEWVAVPKEIEDAK